MRRSRLIWFALGAASVVLCLLISGWISGRFERPVEPFIVLASPHILAVTSARNAAEGDDDANNLSQRLGDAIRSCGFSSFDIAMSVRDMKYILPLRLETQPAIKCVLRSLQGAEYVETIEFKAS